MQVPAIAPELLEILRCPRCRGTLAAVPGALACGACRLAFGVKDGVPNLLLDDATPVGGGAR